MHDTLDLPSLVQAAGDAIIAADTDGKILLWNPAAERIFGFTAEDALGHWLDLIIPERLRTRHWEGYRRVMRTGQTRYGTKVLRVPLPAQGRTGPLDRLHGRPVARRGRWDPGDCRDHPR